MILLKDHDVEWLTRHTMDQIGAVFKYKNRLFRRIRSEKWEFVHTLLKSPCFGELVKKELFPETVVAEDYVFENSNDVILEHKIIDTKIKILGNYFPELFRAAANTVVEINSILLKNGYVLTDPHYGNIAFDGTVPVYIDLGSISKTNLQSCYAGLLCLREEYYHRLKVWMLKQKSFGSGIGVFDEEVFFYPKESYLLRYGRLGEPVYQFCKTCFSILFKLGFALNRKNCAKFMTKRFQHELKKIKKMALSSKTRWGNYQVDYMDKNGSPKNNPRFTAVCNELKSLKVQTSLEIGANIGLLSYNLLVNDIVKNAICTDYDQTALNKGFLFFSANNALKHRISFVKLDVFRDIIRRTQLRDVHLKSDVVLALAITHHLLLSQKLSLTALVDFFAKYANKYLIVEFMPLGLWSEGADVSVPEWYNLEWFLKGLSSCFEVIKTEELAKNRIMVVCKKL